MYPDPLSLSLVIALSLPPANCAYLLALVLEKKVSVKCGIFFFLNSNTRRPLEVMLPTKVGVVFQLRNWTVDMGGAEVVRRLCYVQVLVQRMLEQCEFKGVV